RRRLMDVDQPLVRPDLEVLARVLVLEGRADHAVDVLLGRQRHRPGDGRAGPGRRIDDLLRRGLDRLRVVGLQPDADLVLWGGGHWAARCSLLSTLAKNSWMLVLCGTARAAWTRGERAHASDPPARPTRLARGANRRLVVSELPSAQSALADVYL